LSEWGLNSQGFKAKRLANIKQELEEELRAKIPAQLQFSSSTIAGQLVSIFAAKLDEVWQLASCVYTSLDPDVACGRALTALSSLTGTIRKEATRSMVEATVKLAGNTTLPRGSIAAVAGDPTARFVLLKEVTNGSDKIQEFAAHFEADKEGPFSAPAHTLTVIATPVAGWLSVTNVKDALLGRLKETDVELRLRRVKELRAPGSGTLDSLKAKLEMIPNVSGVLILHNDGRAEKSVPPHTIEAIVMGGDQQEIAETIWQHKALGIGTHGSSMVALKDSQGHEQKIRFSRPELLSLPLCFRRLWPRIQPLAPPGPKPRSTALRPPASWPETWETICMTWL
jgi:uncharacterized phage protein gp47/JayE